MAAAVKRAGLGARLASSAVLICASAPAALIACPTTALAQSSFDILPPRQTQEPAPRRSPQARPAPDLRGTGEREEPVFLRPGIDDTTDDSAGRSNAAGDDRATDPTDTARDAPPAAATAESAAIEGPQIPVLRDGFLDPFEPQPVLEGLAAAEAETRRPEDIAAFEQPPAGHDARLFEIEDIRPRQNRRVEQLFRFEPYDPVGLRVGRFVVFGEAELAGVAYSNVLQSADNVRSDTALELAPRLRLVSQWSRHALEVAGGGRLSYHEDFPSENDRNWEVEARGRLDITRRINLQGLAAQRVSQSSRAGANAISGGDRADITTQEIAGSLNTRFNRGHIQLRAGLVETDYTASQDAQGIIVTNAERDGRVTVEALRVRYDLRSTLAVFGEVELDQRSFAAAPADGLRRDSEGQRYRLGLSFGSGGPRLRGEASLGWGEQKPDAPGLRAVDGLLVDADLVWRMTPFTSLLLRAGTDFVDSVSDGASGVLARRFALGARHQFRAHLIGTAEVETTRSNYRGISLSEVETAARLGAEYYLSREVVLFGGYAHTWFATSDEDGDWQADEVRLGMRMRR